ncbi:MotA/TolQ/ExbB proton channel family protein [bacterium]|nr:MotA/TolQ/ExbB proton channel family protein [bacterium]
MNPVADFAAFFRNGGPFMYAILATGLLVLALTLERFWVIQRAAQLNSAKLGKDLLRLVRGGDKRGAVALCQKVEAPVTRVAKAILQREGTGNPAGEEALQAAADGAATVVLPPLGRRLSYLNMLANTATLLGLLGTIFGLTTAFNAVDTADASQRSAFLAAGISQALNTTAFGLIVAVPALLVHGFLVSKVEGIVDSVDALSVRLISLLTGGAEEL